MQEQIQDQLNSGNSYQEPQSESNSHSMAGDNVDPTYNLNESIRNDKTPQSVQSIIMEEDEDNILSSRRYRNSPSMDLVDQSQNESRNFNEVTDYISS